MTEPKVYPAIEEEPIRFKTCECLHGWSSHGTTWYGKDTNCSKCKCPQYKQLGIFTYSEWISLCNKHGVKP